VFDLRLPDSLADLPGRFVALCWDEDDRPVRALPKPKQTRAARLAKDREWYARNAAKIAAQRKARWAKRTPEQIEAHRAKNRRWLAANRYRLRKSKFLPVSTGTKSGLGGGD